MNRVYFYVFFCAVVFSLILGKVFLAVQKRIKAGQPVYKYVSAHKDKNGTPTMGGLFFILSAVLSFLIFGGAKSRISVVAMVIGLSFMTVGFLDDFIKIRSKQNEGLKPYQKIIFQVTIAFVAGIFAYLNGLTHFYIPFTKNSVNLGVFTIFFDAFIFIAITNSVNLTDGLDGLASSVSIWYLVFLSTLILIQSTIFTFLVADKNNLKNVLKLSISLIGGLLGFKFYNTNKASVFMGDTGSLSLGGFLGAISLFTLNGLFIPVLGIMFVLSSISVIMQVLYYKKTKKRIFLMAPFHHHLQMKGHSEAKICFWYAFVTILVGAMTIFAYF